MGRPPIYTAEIAAQICERLSRGETLRSICEAESMPAPSTVRLWIQQDVNGFAALSARAYESGCHALADECIAIADDARNDFMERQRRDGSTEIAFDAENVQRSKLRIDTRMRLIGKWAPKIYGERTQLEHSGPNGGPIPVAHADMSDEQLAAIASSRAQQ